MSSRGLFSFMSARTRRSLTLLWAALFLCSLLMQYVSFTAPQSVLAALGVNLDQYANTDNAWQNGDLNKNNSAWNEDEVVPFRLAIEGLEPGTHTIHINYDFTAGGHKAYDFLATWNVTENPGECDAGGGGVSSLCPTLGAADTAEFGTDTRTVDGKTVAGAYDTTRLLTMYGGTITEPIPAPVCETTTDGNSSCDYLITFVSTGEAVLFLWGGHLAVSEYWNGPSDLDGAAQVSGAPWHMRTQQLDGSGNKNQDRSIQPSAIIKTVPTISTTASADIEIGGSIGDTAELLGVTADAGGTITFSLYGPNDASCSGAAIFTDTAAVAGPGDYSTDPDFTPTAPGTYRWIAAYSGDLKNNAVSGACNAANESVVVSPVSPTVVTTASAAVSLGGAISDSAVLAGATTGATGNIVFNLYGPNDATCSGTIVFTATVPVSGNGTYGSGSFTPTAAGTYRWIANYSGDANNNPTSNACNAANESVVVRARPQIATVLVGGGTQGASLTLPLGTSVHDTATLTGATSDAGGSVTYTVYTNNTCTTGAQAAGTKTVTNGVVPASDAITFNGAGTFYWQAVYSGDAKNDGATSACTDEVLTITPNPVSINTLLSGQGQTGTNITIQLGNSVTDSSTLTGETANAGGTVTYTVYSNNTCTTAVANAGTVNVTNGVVPNSSSVIFSTAGTFYWQAVYSGDANNVGATSACTAEVVTVIVPALTVLKAVAGNTAGSIGGTPQAKQGDTLTFTLTYDVTNGPVTGGVITDVLPLGYTYVANSATASTPGGEFTFVSFTAATRTLRWTAANVTQDGSVTYQVTVAVGAAELPQPLINVAVIDSNETNPDDDDQPVLVQEPPAPATATPRITPPPTDLDEQTPSNPGFGLLLALLGLAGFVLAIGFLTPVPARARRRDRR
jgi:uncharacterized repeat protein (TIGR01451 family)